MRSYIVLVLALLVLTWPSLAEARDFVYHEQGDSLARTDVTTSQTTVIGTLSRDIYSLEFAPDGRLFAITGSPSSLVEVDIHTAALTEVGTFPGSPPSGFERPWRLAITEDGRFFVATLGMGDGSQLGLWEVDPITTERTVIGSVEEFVNGFTSRGNQLLGLGFYDSPSATHAIFEVSPVDASVDLVQIVATEDFLYFDDADVDADGRIVIQGEPAGNGPRDMIKIDIETGLHTSLFPGDGHPPILPSVLAIRRGSVTEIPTLGQTGALALVALLAGVALLVLRRRVAAGG